MIRISRLADYGVVLMSYMAAHPDHAHAAHEVAAEVHLPLPTVSKLLRLLTRSGLLASHRGVKGGYSLARPPEEISVATVIGAVEGPIGLTLCTVGPPGDCAHETFCPVRRPWQRVNQVILKSLEKISLAEMAPPIPAASLHAQHPNLRLGTREAH